MNFLVAQIDSKQSGCKCNKVINVPYKFSLENPPNSSFHFKLVATYREHSAIHKSRRELKNTHNTPGQTFPGKEAATSLLTLISIKSLNNLLVACILIFSWSKIYDLSRVSIEFTSNSTREGKKKNKKAKRGEKRRRSEKLILPLTFI